ncbi:MAG TPA: helix-turn-helix transcriptional regulator [Candidatus Saccharimonadia bacterium]|nr:helix-turn-helix transcriptional regulator [Candidatus Saccharimonadia bacterium]
MIDRTKLGMRIREARQRMNMSQQQLAAAIGVSDKTISAYEVGRVDPPLDTLEKLSTATAHPIAYFVGDVQSNIEARLDRIANELTEIRKTLKTVSTPMVKEAPTPTVPATVTDPETQS